MRFKWFLIITGLALLLGPTIAVSQPGGGGRGGPGGGGFAGGGSFDPNDRWTQYTGGKPVWRRSEITDPGLLRRFDRTAQMVGATNGEITKEQFLSSMQGLAQRGGRGGPMATFAAPGAVPVPGAPQGPGQPSPGAGGGWNPDMMAEMRFRRMDTNGDGVLNYDEMDDALRAERDKWDTNHDGFIDLNEFKEYMKARVQQYQASAAAQGGNGQPWDAGAAQALEPEEKRPTVYRAGKLPPNLPAWFTQYDTDHDGQIGLYEWKAAGMPIAQFEAMDRNGDGFLTVEEVLRTVAPVAQVGGGAANPGGMGSPGFAGAVAMGQAGFPGAFPAGPGAFQGGAAAFPGGRGNRGPGGPGGPGGFGDGGGGRGNRGPGGPGGDASGGGGGRGNRGPGGPGADAGGGGGRGNRGFPGGNGAFPGPGGGAPGASGAFPGGNGAFPGGRGNGGPGNAGDASGNGAFPGANGAQPGGGRGGRGGRGNRGGGQ